MHPCQLVTLEGHTMNVTAVSFHNEGKWLVTGSEDGTIRIWDLRCVNSVQGGLEILYLDDATHHSSSSVHRIYDNGAPGVFG